MTGAFLDNLLSPPLLFFFLGAMAVFLRSDLDIPGQIARFLSLYLLFAIGFKGGVALAGAPIDGTIWLMLLAAVALSAVVPLYCFAILRRRLPTADAAAVAATYGSVSAVTFITAAGYLDAQNVAWGGHMVAAMALMESPAIMVGILLNQRFRTADSGEMSKLRWGPVLHESCFNSSVFLILGSMLIGWLTGEEGMAQIEAVVKAPFLGVLCLFLLDMGIVAARRIRDLGRSTEGRSGSRASVTVMVSFGLVFPLVNAAIALAVTVLLGLAEGESLLFTVLVASASYIAVPAAMRLALPEANPSIYLPMSLAVTFPFNILVGIPLYHQIVLWLG